jgi:hypothetical protein
MDRLFLCLERHCLKMSTEHVRNNTDRVEPKYWDKNLLQSHVFLHHISYMERLRTETISPRFKVGD